jgi:hypothetical protein
MRLGEWGEEGREWYPLFYCVVDMGRLGVNSVVV